MKPICLYCGSAAEFVSGSDIYRWRPDLALLKFWRCSPCGAYVGCHKAGSYEFKDGAKIRHDGTEPLGRLADADLRRAKMAAHTAFDPLWKSKGWGRRQAYSWLAGELALPVDRTHIGEFDSALCARGEVCKPYNVANNRIAIDREAGSCNSG